MSTVFTDLEIRDVSLVTITPDMIRGVAGRCGVTEDAVRAYLAGPEQDDALLDAFLFFGVGPVGKLPVPRVGLLDEAQAQAAFEEAVLHGPTKAPIQWVLPPLAFEHRRTREIRHDADMVTIGPESGSRRFVVVEPPREGLRSTQGNRLARRTARAQERRTR